MRVSRSAEGRFALGHAREAWVVAGGVSRVLAHRGLDVFDLPASIGMLMLICWLHKPRLERHLEILWRAAMKLIVASRPLGHWRQYPECGRSGPRCSRGRGEVGGSLAGPEVLPEVTVTGSVRVLPSPWLFDDEKWYRQGLCPAGGSRRRCSVSSVSGAL